MRGELRRQTLLLLSPRPEPCCIYFYLWYGKPGLTLAYLCALVIHLGLAGVSWRRIFLCAVTLIVFANPIQLGSALGSRARLRPSYLSAIGRDHDGPASAVRFPQVWSTITEARSLPWHDTLKQILPRADMAVVGLGAFALFAVWRWRAIAGAEPHASVRGACPAVVATLYSVSRAVRRDRLGRYRFFDHAGAARPARRKFGRTSLAAPQTSRPAAWLRAARSLSSTPHSNRRRVCRGHRCLLRLVRADVGQTTRAAPGDPGASFSQSANPRETVTR